MARVSKQVRGVYERRNGSGVWWIRYANVPFPGESEGKIEREKAGSKEAAILLLGKRKLAVQRAFAEGKLPEIRKRVEVLFSELIDDAQKKAELKNGSAAQRNLRSIVTALKPVFAKRIASSITTSELQEFLVKMREENEWAEGTFNHYVTQLRLIFRMGIKAKKVWENPAADLDKFSMDNGRPRFLTVEEETALEALIREQFPQHEGAFKFAKNTGLRAGAQFSLRWSQIDFRRKEMTLPPKRNSKYRKNWVLPLNAQAWQVIVARKDNGSPLVFAEYQKPSWMVNPSQWFPLIVKAAGVENFTWHGLRHNFASQLVMRGVNLRTVQQLMCHTDIKQTARYADLSADHLREAAEMMQRLPIPTDTKTDTTDSRQLAIAA